MRIDRKAANKETKIGWSTILNRGLTLDDIGKGVLGVVTIDVLGQQSDNGQYQYRITFDQKELEVLTAFGSIQDLRHELFYLQERLIQAEKRIKLLEG